jgi:hypothetical protein
MSFDTPGKSVLYGNGLFSINPGVVKTNITPLVRELAARLGHWLIDMHVAMDGHREWFPDSVHPNSRGTTVMATVVRNAIVTKSTGEPPVLLAIGRVTPTHVALSWSSDWAGLVLQSATALQGEGTVWTVVEQVAFNDGWPCALRTRFPAWPGFTAFGSHSGMERSCPSLARVETREHPSSGSNASGRPARSAL